MILKPLKDDGRPPLNMSLTTPVGKKILAYIKREARADDWRGMFAPTQFMALNHKAKMHHDVYGNYTSVTFDTEADMSFFILRMGDLYER